MERAVEEHVKASGWRLILPGVAVALVVIGVAAVVRSNPRLGTPLLLAAMLLAVYRQSLYRRLAEAYLKRDAPAAGKRTYIFRDHGITVQLPGARGQVDWSVWTGVVETEEFYLLLVKSRLPSPVPKRAFRDAADQHRFRSQISRHARQSRLLAETEAAPSPDGPASAPG